MIHHGGHAWLKREGLDLHQSGYPMLKTQTNLFEPDTLPRGLVYRPSMMSVHEEKVTLFNLAGLSFSPFEFHGFVGNRRTVSFGWRYDFSGYALRQCEPLPEFLSGLREKAAALAGIEANNFEHALVNEYRPGAGIGWHRDKAVFDLVVGFSLGGPCRLRFRRKDADRWDRLSFEVEPRSAYFLSGPARKEWEHSIPPHRSLRYSVTFRTLVSPQPLPARDCGPP
jgi:alkylated DNA repair dioxygenase AlkB